MSLEYKTQVGSNCQCALSANFVNDSSSFRLSFAASIGLWSARSAGSCAVAPRITVLILARQSSPQSVRAPANASLERWEYGFTGCNARTPYSAGSTTHISLVAWRDKGICIFHGSRATPLVTVWQLCLYRQGHHINACSPIENALDETGSFLGLS